MGRKQRGNFFSWFKKIPEAVWSAAWADPPLSR